MPGGQMSPQQLPYSLPPGAAPAGLPPGAAPAAFPYAHTPYQGLYPYYQNQYYQGAPGYPPQHSQPYLPNPASPPATLAPSPAPAGFTPEQLALFTPEQRAQILQWSQASSPAPGSSPLPPAQPELFAPVPVLPPTIIATPPASSPPPITVTTPPVSVPQQFLPPPATTAPVPIQPPAQPTATLPAAISQLAPVMQYPSVRTVPAPLVERPKPVPSPLPSPSLATTSRVPTPAPPSPPQATTSKASTTTTTAPRTSYMPPATSKPQSPTKPAISTPSSAPLEADKRKEDSANLLKETANRLVESKDYQSAISYYSLALDYTPSSAIILANRSSAYFSWSQQAPASEESPDKGKLTEAYKDALKATECDPGYWKGWSRLGQCLIAKGEAEKAIPSLEKAIQLGGADVGEPTRKLLEKARTIIQGSRSPPPVPSGSGIRTSTQTAPAAPTRLTTVPANPPSYTGPPAARTQSKYFFLCRFGLLIYSLYQDPPVTQVPVPPAPPPLTTPLTRRESVAQRNYASPTSASRPANTAQEVPASRLSDTTTTAVLENDPSLPSYAPSFDSTDPSIRALNTQVLIEELNAMTNHLKIKNKGAVALRTQAAGTAANSVKAIQVVYSYMVATELTSRETGQNTPLHTSYGT